MKNPSYRNGRVKGAAIREFVAWHVSVQGTGPLERAIRALRPEQQDEFALDRDCLGVLPSVWFPGEVVHGVLDRLTDGLDARAYDALVQGGAEATVKGLMTGAQRIVFSTLLSPRTYTKVASLTFTRSSETAGIENEELGPKRHRGTVEDWASHHPFLCRMNVAIKGGIYRAIGCKSVRIEERFCRSDGQPQCGSVIAWD